MNTTRFLPCLSAQAVQPAAAAPAEDPLVARMRATWTAGDFHAIAEGFARGAAEFVAALGLEPGERVLDIACGSGNLAIPAARAGARVTGLDIAPNLLATARRLAEEEGLALRLDEGNAEKLPYADASFDVVLSMFGIMFTARPECAATEARRVLRPGGTIALANWTPSGFVGRMLRLHVARVPAPKEVPSPLQWGDELFVRRLLPGARLTCTERTIDLAWPLPPAGVARLFAECYGPTVRTMAALDGEGRAGFLADLAALWTAHNVATDGTTRVPAEYLAVLGTVN